MIRFKNFDVMLNIQIAFAFMISIFVSQSIGLTHPITAGIITILSIQTTRKQTIIIAFKRLLGFLIMVILSTIIFRFIGFSLFSFGVLVLIFSIICSKLDISIGLGPNVVIASHIFLENKVEFNFLINEMNLYFIGLFIAVLVNLLIPHTIKKDRIDRKKLDKYIKNMLVYISNLLNENYIIEDKKNDRELYFMYINNEITKITKYIEKYEFELIKNIENDLFGNDFYDLEYLELRHRQFIILVRIFYNTKRIDRAFLQTQKISNFINEINEKYDEDNNAELLIQKADRLVKFFEKAELPKSRVEFENRAILFVILEDLVVFLKEKYKFKK